MGMLLRRYHKSNEESVEEVKEDLVNEEVEVDQEESTEDNQVDLADKNVTELKELAKEAGVENYSKLKKAELIKELNSL